MTMIFLQAPAAPGNLTVTLDVDNFVNLAMAKLEQPGNPTFPVPTTAQTLSSATWTVGSVGTPAITFSIDWLGVAPQGAGSPFNATVTVTDSAGAPLAAFAGSANPLVEGCVIGPPENPTFAGTFGVAVA
jgi:hypothetical protein